MKNILLAVVGLSPQVITETLFALHQENHRVDAIHIITTRGGKEKVNACLLSRKDGQYYRYLAEYGILGLDAENFNSYKGKIRSDIQRGFGLSALTDLAIESTGKRPDTRYGVKIDASKIRITF